MRVAILFNDEERLEHGEAVDDIAVQAVRDAVDAVETVCRGEGWEPTRLAVGGGGPIDADVVVNLVEGREEPAAARLLEAAGLPYTGSTGDALQLAQDKPAARAVLEAAGVPIPRGCVLKRGDGPIERLRYPVIVKPARQDASHGIVRESLAVDEASARARARYLVERYRQPALVEEFVAGAELGVSLLGPAEVLPMSEIAFGGDLRLLTYASKWLPESSDYRLTPVVARDEPHTGAAAVARAAWSALGLRDYGRVDVRLSLTGEPFVLDVNPNPDLAPDAGLARAAERAGIDYAELVARIVKGARERGSSPAPASS